MRPVFVLCTTSVGDLFPTDTSSRDSTKTYWVLLDSPVSNLLVSFVFRNKHVSGTPTLFVQRKVWTLVQSQRFVSPTPSPLPTSLPPGIGSPSPQS